MTRQLMPKAVLESRRTDVPLTPSQILDLALFQELKRKPNLDKFPGALVMRRYRKGEVIFRQGEPGWTAFYVLPTEDLVSIQKTRLDITTRGKQRLALQREMETFENRLRQMENIFAEENHRMVGTVYFAVARASRGKRTWWERLSRFKRTLMTDKMKNSKDQSFYIPVNGPKTLSYDSFRAPLQEGELFGEMSCLYRVPRAATVVAQRDCYVLEMLRNILEMIQRDPTFRSYADEIYRKRVLELQLRNIPLFNKLPKEQYDRVIHNVELVTYDPGEVIFDENEKRDNVYLIRRGLVKVTRDSSWLLSPSDITDSDGLVRALKRKRKSKTSLLASLRLLLKTLAIEKGAKEKLVDLLNELIRSRTLLGVDEFQPLRQSSSMQKRIQDYPEKQADWTDQQLRRHNRLLLELILPQYLRCREQGVGPEQVITYSSSGEMIGEQEVIERKRRRITCTAYGHPNHHGQLELVRIKPDLFWSLVESSQEMRMMIDQQVEEKKAQAEARLSIPLWDEQQHMQYSDRFEELGLIQGQQLMLIDLDRCTRCDDCVNACAATHADGHSRLYLEGPRLDKYLVPMTCRSCLDPVCLIGCPVGSIHRGDDREIIVEDWCIGCGACADNCPYDSIEMHDLGMIPSEARGWRYLPLGMVKSKKWQRRWYRDDHWLEGRAPFSLNRDLMTLLGQRAEKKGEDLSMQTVCFRRTFEMATSQIRRDSQYRVEMVAEGGSVRLWINGVLIEPDGKPKRNRYEYTLPAKGEDGLKIRDVFRTGTNVIAVEVLPPGEIYGTVMQLRLDKVRKPKDIPQEMEEQLTEEVTQKLVTHRAVVCDLCSSLPGSKPACVQACPHDAAMRVSAGTEMPTG